MVTDVPAAVSAAILQPSEPVPDTAVSVRGPDFDANLSLQDLLKSYERIGFQASNLGKAINIVNGMVSQVLSHGTQHNLSSADGGSQTILSQRVSQISISIPKFVLGRVATYSWAIRPILFLPAFAMSSCIS